MNINEKVFITTSGIVIRNDAKIGLLAFSPYSSNFYAIRKTDAKRIVAWLMKKTHEIPDPIYSKTLGIGWSSKTESVEALVPHLLPSYNAWSILPTPSHPLLINWFLTGNCPLACKYCYAEDLMRNKIKEPDGKAVERIADNVISRRPLAVVLTGGDPLFSPYFETALAALHKRVGIVVDTSGYTFTKKHLELMIKYNASIRISIDSEQPKIHELQRPLFPEYMASFKNVGSLSPALNTLNACIDAGLTTTVQTVATRKNTNDLLSLGDKLFRLGVNSWRILKVAPSVARFEGYRKLIGTHFDSGKRVLGKQATGPYNFIFKKLMQRHSNDWRHRMHLQITDNEVLNSVILVAPDGTFYTESNLMLGKIVIDEKSPRNPSLKAIWTNVNLGAHAARYLNVTTTAFIQNEKRRSHR